MINVGYVVLKELALKKKKTNIYSQVMAVVLALAFPCPWIYLACIKIKRNSTHGEID